MEYKVRLRKPVFQGKAFAIRIDEIERSDGAVQHIEIVDHPGAVALVPVDNQGRVLFVRQYRHASGRTLLELPAGTLEPGEDPSACARRECQEEVGMAPGRLTRLGGFFMAPGYSTEYIHLFLAEDLIHSPLDPDADEDIQVVPLTPAEIDRVVAEGELEDAKSLAGLELARRRSA
jgi:ADP-ribose pyrophosphatase